MPESTRGRDWKEVSSMSLTRRRFLAGIPVALLFNVFLDDFVEGITGGALKGA